MPVLRSAAEDRRGGPFLEQPGAELEALPERASAIRSLMQRFESCAHSAAAEVERDGLDSLKRWVTDILPRARARPLPGMLDAAVVVGACEQLHERLADVCMPCSAPLHRLARSASDALGHAASELEQAYGALRLFSLPSLSHISPSHARSPRCPLVMHSDGEGELDDCAGVLFPRPSSFIVPAYINSHFALEPRSQFQMAFLAPTASSVFQLLRLHRPQLSNQCSSLFIPLRRPTRTR